MRIRLFFIFWLGVLGATAGQNSDPFQPFVCDGAFYQAMAPFLSSALHEVVVDSNGAVQFVMLPAGNVGTSINPIGYRVSDNFIYGISPSDLNLYRIGADGSARRLAFISELDDGLDYPAGAISPDGRYFVLLAIEQGREPQTGSSRHLLFIDLEAADYPTRKLLLPENSVQTFDIAFDPIDGALYGYNATTRQLIRINVDNGDMTALPTSNPDAESLGALFFDPFGNLFAYGNRNRLEKQSSYFSIDKTTGRATLLARGPEAQLTDGCSCPYTVAMQEEVEPLQALACTELSVTLTLVNSSGVERSGLVLTDTFPAGFSIVAVDHQLEARLSSGLGGRLLRMEDLRLPLGESQVRITLQTSAGTDGAFPNQAFLNGLPAGLGRMVRSDNPATLLRNDPTELAIQSLEAATFNRDLSICPGEALELDPGIEGVSYAWDDGSTQPTRTIDGPGQYSARVSTDCRTDTVRYNISLDELSLDLPPDATLQLGDSLLLRPAVFPHDDLDYRWSSSSEPLACATCSELWIKPLFDDTYALSVYDPLTGCAQSDSLQVRVLKNREVFMPNAFSPNGDGQNDRFFPQSRVAEEVQRFRVFNRWGELVYQAGPARTNDPDLGWDGTSRGRPLPQGMYFYVLEVRFLDQTRRLFQGEITLVR